jgi:hypothetical protein
MKGQQGGQFCRRQQQQQQKEKRREQGVTEA